MSNLSIQNLLSKPVTDIAGRSRTPGQATDTQTDARDPAQAFNEVMQRTTTREGTPQARAPQDRSTQDRGPERQNTRPAEHASERRNASADAPTRNTPTTAQPPRQTRRDESSATGQATDKATSDAARTPAGRAKPDSTDADANGVDATDAPETATGDLFADLALALGSASPATPTPTDPLAQASAASSAALIEALKKAGPKNIQTEAFASDTATPGAATAVNTGLHTSTTAADALHTALDANALMQGAQPPLHLKNSEITTSDARVLNETTAELDHALSAAMDKLAALVTGTEGRSSAAARADNTPLSLSAALSGVPASGLNPAGLIPASAPTTFSIAHAQIKTEVGAYGFAEDFSQRVVMLAGQRVQSAEIALTPSDLGPISVSMQMRGQEASLVFGATHSATRAALEDALPRLREMFQANGLHLVDAHVGAQLGHSGQRQTHTDGQAAGSNQNHGRGAMNTLAPIGGAGGVRSDAAAGVSSTLSTRLIDVRV